MINKVINEAGAIGKEIAKPVYKDAVQPVAKEIGQSLKTIGELINVALIPISLMVYGFDKIQENLRLRLENKLSSILPENIISPPLQIVGPLVDKYRYVYNDEDLSEMFVNLLAKSMDKENIQKSHPAFVNIISELSSEEAKLIKIINSEKSLPKLDVRIKTNKGIHLILSNFTLLGHKARLQYPEFTPQYLNNLERLNIIKCSLSEAGESYVDKNIYKSLKEDRYLKDLASGMPQGHILDLKEGVIRITDFGKMFIEAIL